MTRDDFLTRDHWKAMEKCNYYKIEKMKEILERVLKQDIDNQTRRDIINIIG